MEKEKWKVITYAPKYMVSNYGNILSMQRRNPKLLAQKTDKNSYKTVHLCCMPGKPKDFLVHRLVLEMFMPIENMQTMEVNHIDEIKSNNYIGNLEWSTPKENCNYGKRNAILSKKQSRKVICIETGIVYSSSKLAAEATGTCRSSISNCLNGIRNKAGGYHWEAYNE